MATYTPSKVLLPTGLDEFGLRVSLNRFESEVLDDYRRRLLLEVAQPSGSSAENHARAVSRKVGLFDVPAIRFELILDVDDNPVAADPAIVVTASRLYAYSDYDAGTLDVELALTDRTQEYFVQDVVDAFSGSTFFTVTLLDATLAYRRSDQLAVGTNIRYQDVLRLPPKEVYDFNIQYLRDVRFTDPQLFRTEVAVVGDIEELGEYFLDRVNGVVFTYSSMGGAATVEYAKFPYDHWWQSVRSYEFRDEDVKYIIYDNLLDTDGTSQPLLLNSQGAKMLNELLAAHPLEWGE